MEPHNDDIFYPEHLSSPVLWMVLKCQAGACIGFNKGVTCDLEIWPCDLEFSRTHPWPMTCTAIQLNNPTNVARAGLEYKVPTKNLSLQDCRPQYLLKCRLKQHQKKMQPLSECCLRWHFDVEFNRSLSFPSGDRVCLWHCGVWWVSAHHPEEWPRAAAARVQRAAQIHAKLCKTDRKRKQAFSLPSSLYFNNWHKEHWKQKGYQDGKEPQNGEIHFDCLQRIMDVKQQLKDNTWP